MLKSHRSPAVFLTLSVILTSSLSLGQELTLVAGVERQPLMASVRRVVEALEFAGAPLSDDAVQQLDEINRIDGDRRAVREL